MCPPLDGSTGEKTTPTVAKVLAAALQRPPNLCAHVWKTLNAILCCRTPALGVHHYRCVDCGRDHIMPHSCRNRHCPDCQGANAHEWLERQEGDLLPVPYFHVVFTLPHSLNPLILQNPRAMHNLLFQCASATLMEFAHNKFGVRPGLTTVLHTWGQAILDHNHLHCIVTGGGLSADGTRWRAIKPNYLFPVRALSIVFAAKYRDGLKALYAQGKLEFHGKLAGHAEPDRFARFVREACRTKWNVYVKRPFGGPKQLLAYLSRYTHRIAIGNRRILALDSSARTVTFSYKDYAADSKQKTMTLTLDEFLRRFCLHILPSRFVKIRHYGLLANRGRDTRVERARQLLGQTVPSAPPDASDGERLEKPAAETPNTPPQVTCGHCGSIRLNLITITYPRRPTRTPKTNPACALDSS